MKKEIKALTRSAQFEPSTANVENRTVEMVWTTGARVLRSTFFDGPFYEELSISPESVRLERLNNGAPVLNSHQQNTLSDVLGVVEKAWITGNEGRALVRFSQRADVEPFWQDVKSGIVRNVSVGYRIYKMEKTAEVDNTPVYRATDWEPMELSMVPVGADAASGIRSDAELNVCEITDEKGENEMEQTTEGVEQHQVEETPEREAQAPAAPQASETVDVEGTRKQAADAERARAVEIFEVCGKAKLENDVARKFIESGASIETVRKEIIDMISTKETIKTAHVEMGGQDESQTRKEGAEVALLHRAMPGLFKMEEKGRPYANMSLLRMAEEFVGPRARTMSRSQIARSALMTSDFVELMGNTAGKVLRRAYELQPKTFQPFVTQGTLVDYKPVKRIAFGESPELKAIAEGADYELGTVGESAETIQVAKYGRAVHLSDILIQNDDLQAFTRLPQLFGAAAARLESKMVYTDLLLANPTMADGKALFHADHANLASASAIDVAGLSAARKLMRAQKGIDGQDYLDLMPSFLVVGPDKETEAKQMLSAQMVPNSINEVNPFMGSLQLIVDSRIDGNKWFLVASPSSIDTIEVAYLDGMAGPEVSTETWFDSDVVKYKVKHVVGAKAIDFRGMVYNPGA